MEKQLRVILLSVFVVLGGGYLLSPQVAQAEGLASSCGTCFGSLLECSDNVASCDGAPIWRCQENHFCCSTGEWYGFCERDE